ncbi:hypothetical protein Tco_1427248 [Tanacetum coccineum]
MSRRNERDDSRVLETDSALKRVSSQGFEGVDGLASVLVEDDASSLKRFLPVMDKDSFCCWRQTALLRL